MNGHGYVNRLLAQWQELRAGIRAEQEAEHPDVTDKYGRVWTWVSRDLYRHDQLAWPLKIIESPHFGLPSPGLAANPNYHLCDICTQDWPNRRTPHGQDEDANRASHRQGAGTAGAGSDPEGVEARGPADPEA